MSHPSCHRVYVFLSNVPPPTHTDTHTHTITHAHILPSLLVIWVGMNSFLLPEVDLNCIRIIWASHSYDLGKWFRNRYITQTLVSQRAITLHCPPSVICVLSGLCSKLVLSKWTKRILLRMITHRFFPSLTDPKKEAHNQACVAAILGQHCGNIPEIRASIKDVEWRQQNYRNSLQIPVWLLNEVSSGPRFQLDEPVNSVFFFFFF